MFAARNAIFTGTPPVSQVEFKGVNTAANRSSGVTTVTIPTHQAGDLLLMWVSDVNNYQTLTKPSAGGTVPTWTTIGATTSDNYLRHSIYYAVATSSSTTSGTWGNIKLMMAVVLSGQNASSPIGNYALYENGSGSTVYAPGISISNNATSQLLFFGSVDNATWNSTVTSGYTAKTSATTNGVGYRLITKDNPTDAGGYLAPSVGTFSASTVPVGSVSLEILK